jgi:TDG/mug DNA glycosylase family protein
LNGGWEDILRPGLDLVVVGYNPSLVAWRTGHYYANPGNRFYRLLWECGLTPVLLAPEEDRTLPEHGIGLTDIVHAPSAGIDDIAPSAFRAAVPATIARLAACAPRAICCNGVGVARLLLGRAPVNLSRQPVALPTLPATALFVVPSSSGRCNGRAAERLAAYRAVADYLGRRPSSRPP